MKRWRMLIDRIAAHVESEPQLRHDFNSPPCKLAFDLTELLSNLQLCTATIRRWSGLCHQNCRVQWLGTW